MALAYSPQPRPAATVADQPTGFVAGGQVAQLQREIEERLLGASPDGLAMLVEPDTAHRLSRLAGPALLLVAYAGVMLWWWQ